MTPSAPRISEDELAGVIDARIRAAEPPPYSTDEFKAGWHHAVSASLTAVARARLAAARSAPAAHDDWAAARLYPYHFPSCGIRTYKGPVAECDCGLFAWIAALAAEEVR